MLYKKLWKALIDWDMTQTDLRQAAGISLSMLALMNKNLPNTTTIVEKISKALLCQPDDEFNAKNLRTLKNRDEAKFDIVSQYPETLS